MTVKKVEIVSVTIPEWNLLTTASQLLVDIAINTGENMPIHRKAKEAVHALEAVMDEIEETCGC